MLTKMLHPSILILLSLAACSVGHAADMAIDCKLKGGSVVQLPAEACKMEGGAPASAAATPSSLAAPVSPAPIVAPVSATNNEAQLTPMQQLIVDLLVKPVGASSADKNPEGIARTVKFDGCRLFVDEQLRIQYGNLFSASRDFKMDSVIDLRNINRDEFGVLGKTTSKGGDLGGVAVYFEEPKRKGGNNISIAVLNLRKGEYTKYTSHEPGAYWDAPRDDFWMTDEYGYVKDNGFGNPVTDKVRILFIVSSSDDAAKLKNALEEVNAMCKPQQAETH